MTLSLSNGRFSGDIRSFSMLSCVCWGCCWVLAACWVPPCCNWQHLPWSPPLWWQQRKEPNLPRQSWRTPKDRWRFLVFEHFLLVEKFMLKSVWKKRPFQWKLRNEHDEDVISCDSKTASMGMYSFGWIVARDAKHPSMCWPSFSWIRSDVHHTADGSEIRLTTWDNSFPKSKLSEKAFHLRTLTHRFLETKLKSFLGSISHGFLWEVKLLALVVWRLRSVAMQPLWKEMWQKSSSKHN